MLILAIGLYLGFFRSLYFVFFESRGDVVLWRIAWFLLSLLSLLIAMHFSISYFDLTVFMDKYKWYVRSYFFFTIVSFYLGGWLQSKKLWIHYDKKSQITFIQKLYRAANIFSI